MLAGKPLSTHKVQRFTQLSATPRNHLRDDHPRRPRRATMTAWNFSPRVDFFPIPGVIREIAQTPRHRVLSTVVSTNAVAFKPICSIAGFSVYATGGRP